MQPYYELRDDELDLVVGGQFGGFGGSGVFGSPYGFGGYGTFGGPFGAGDWGSLAGPLGFSSWNGAGYTGPYGFW